MACNHYRRQLLIEGRWNDPTPTLCKTFQCHVWKCPSCGAIRVDTSTTMMYAEGKWSLPDTSLRGSEAIRSDVFFGAELVKEDEFRIPHPRLINADVDMVRVTIDMPKSTWRKLRKRLPPNKGYRT